MKGYERIADILSAAILIAAGVAGVCVYFLDFMGTDFENGPWRWLKGPLPVTLLTVALLALAVGVERIVRFHQIARRLDDIEHLVTEGPKTIISALGGVEFHRFSDAAELYRYASKRMHEAKRTIDDLSFR